MQHTYRELKRGDTFSLGREEVIVLHNINLGNKGIIVANTHLLHYTDKNNETVKVTGHYLLPKEITEYLG